MKAAFFLMVLAIRASAANWYVQPNGTGNGTSWSSAWKPNTVAWSSVQPGDTIWLAGGNYTSGFMPGKSGSAGSLIYVKRATAGDSAATSATGWQASFDSQAVIISGNGFQFLTAGVGSFLYVDGRKPDGIKLNFSSDSWSSGAVTFRAGGMHDITFTNIDMAGPGGTTPYNHQGDCSVVGIRPSGGVVYNVTVADSKLHGGPNLVYNLGGNYNFTFLRCKFYDNGSANSAIHANMIYTSGGNRDWTFAFCDFSNWQVEGINLYQQTSHPHYFYGNTFHDPMGSNARCFWLANESGSPTGPIYLYNNVFVGVNITIAESRASPATSTSRARNNIYWNATWWSGSAIADSDYNFSNGTIPGANSISGGSNPFMNEAANDFRIVNTVGAKYPKDKGTAITGLPFNLNPDGGAWDMGLVGAGAAPTNPLPQLPAPTGLKLVKLPPQSGPPTPPQMEVERTGDLIITTVAIPPTGVGVGISWNVDSARAGYWLSAVTTNGVSRTNLIGKSSPFYVTNLTGGVTYQLTLRAYDTTNNLGLPTSIPWYQQTVQKYVPQVTRNGAWMDAGPAISASTNGYGTSLELFRLRVESEPR